MNSVPGPYVADLARGKQYFPGVKGGTQGTTLPPPASSRSGTSAGLAQTGAHASTRRQGATGRPVDQAHGENAVTAFFFSSSSDSFRVCLEGPFFRLACYVVSVLRRTQLRAVLWRMSTPVLSRGSVSNPSLHVRALFGALLHLAEVFKHVCVHSLCQWFFFGVSSHGKGAQVRTWYRSAGDFVGLSGAVILSGNPHFQYLFYVKPAKVTLFPLSMFVGREGVASGCLLNWAQREASAY